LFQHFPGNGCYLIRGFSGSKDGFRIPLAQAPVMIDHGEAQVFEWQVFKLVHRLIDIDFARLQTFQEIPDILFFHVIVFIRISIQASGAVALQIERDKAEPDFFEFRGDLFHQGQVEKQGALLRRDLNSCQISMFSDTEAGQAPGD